MMKTYWMVFSDQPIKTILADDCDVFVEGLRLMLSKDPRIEVIDVCHNGKEVVESDVLHSAKLLLMDINMPVMNGIDAAIRINFGFPRLPMIAITMHNEHVYLNEIIGAGFKAFIYKPEIHGTLFQVIDKVIRNQYVLPDSLKLK